MLDKDQDLFDFSIQEYGTIIKSIDIAIQNSKSITDDFRNFETFDLPVTPKNEQVYSLLRKQGFSKIATNL